MSNRPFGAPMDPASVAPRIGSSYPKVGDRSDDDEVRYPDIDMLLTRRSEGRVFCHDDGRPYDTD